MRQFETVTCLDPIKVTQSDQEPLMKFMDNFPKGMITWAIRENIRNPMPDYSSSPLETLNNIWDINPNEKGSIDTPDGRFDLTLSTVRTK